MDKMKLHSPDLSQDNIAKIRALFPGCVTEAADENGKLRLAVDFDQLRQELSDHIVEGGQERYRLDWPGKREALLAANAPIAETLKPIRDESVVFETTRNLLIEGDNLAALKILQENYLGAVKAIYIDPPYNTGSDFIYRDDFSESSQEYLMRSNQISESGSCLVSNPDSNGRFHSDWLSMIYSRLKLARNLLTDDGAIFISIDDNEIHNMRKICDEIFGEENFVNCVSVKLSEATGVKMSHAGSRFPKTKEYVLFYRRGSEIKIKPVQVENGAWNNEYKEIILGFTKSQIEDVKQLIYKETSSDDDVRALNALLQGAGISSLANYFRENEILDEKEKDDFKWSNAWRIIQAVGAGSLKDRAIEARQSDQELSAVLSARGKLSIFKTNFDLTSRDPRIRVLFADKYLTHNPGDFWSDIKTAGGVALEGGVSFPNGKKPLKLIKRLIDTVTTPSGDDIILDFFAGSGTTGHATIDLNSEDGGARRFILVQMRERADEKSEAFKDGLEYVSDICKERMRRAGKKILEGECHANWNKDVGFRVLKIDTSNMEDVYYRPDEVKQADLLTAVDNVKPDRTAEDLLFQVLVDWGVDLTLPIRRETVQGKTVFFVDDNALVACFDTGITEDLVKELAGHEPLRVVFRDNGFVSDAVKINVEQIFRQLSPTTDVKSI
jgi:adenine-specific DNA-methyltransferase